ncbi:MAG: purine-nucleoside phosphorylase [Deltaproteobacteria bacterium]|nr:purine-nucleoside phosphorylase [Deltaproteobacteria bacterium]
MHPEYVSRVQEATEFIRRRAGQGVRAALVAGTGLSNALEGLVSRAEIPYGEIPHFPASTAPGHEGRLVMGELSGTRVLAFKGRFHLYEGYSALQVTFPVRVARELGAQTLVLANAVGGLNPGFAPGDIVLVEDHINLTGENPLVGKNHGPWGPRFPEMGAAYDPGLKETALSGAARRGLVLQRGVYAGLKGPSLETPAEMAFLRAVGADMVGFSMVNEVIAAVHGGMKALGLAVVTNVNVPGALTPATLDEILAVAQKAAPSVAAVISEVAAAL